MSDAKPGYDEALFLQALRRETGGTDACTHDDIVRAFWTAAADLLAAILKQRPDIADPIADGTARDFIIKTVAHIATDAGFKIVAQRSAAIVQFRKR